MTLALACDWLLQATSLFCHSLAPSCGVPAVGCWCASRWIFDSIKRSQLEDRQQQQLLLQ